MKVIKLSKKSAAVLVVFVVAIIAFCLANVFAGMVGTYSLNLFNDDNATELNTINNSSTNIEVNTHSSVSSSDSPSEDVYVSNQDNHQQDTDNNKPSNPPSEEDSTGDGDHSDSNHLTSSSHNN